MGVPFFSETITLISREATARLSKTKLNNKNSLTTQRAESLLADVEVSLVVQDNSTKGIE